MTSVSSRVRSACRADRDRAYRVILPEQSAPEPDAKVFKQKDVGRDRHCEEEPV
jgi:hypothetical protein